MECCPDNPTTWTSWRHSRGCSRSGYSLACSTSSYADGCAERPGGVSYGCCERVSVIDKELDRHRLGNGSKTTGYRRVAREGEDPWPLPREQISRGSELRTYSRSARVGFRRTQGNQAEGLGTAGRRCRAGFYALLRRPERQAQAGRAPQDRSQGRV